MSFYWSAQSVAADNSCTLLLQSRSVQRRRLVYVWHAEKGLLLLLGRCILSFIWLQQVEPSSFNEAPKGKKKKTPQCSMTYLAGEEEALAKRKGKTLYTHKLHGCGLGGCRLLINRQGTQKERSKAGEEPLTLQRNTKCRHKRRNYKKQGWVFRPILQWLRVFSFSFSLIAFQPVPPAPTLSSRLRTQKERRAAGTTQKHNKKGNKIQLTHKNTGRFFFFPHAFITVQAQVKQKKKKKSPLTGVKAREQTRWTINF